MQTLSTNFDLETHVAGFQEFSHRHLAENIRTGIHKLIYVNNTLEVQKGFTFEGIVTDGGADIKSACKGFLHPWYHCASHNLHLCVQNSLKTPGVKRVIKKVNRFIKLERKSPRCVVNELQWPQAHLC